MSGNRIITFAGYKLCINDQVYEPSDDSKLILDILNIGKNEVGIDVGTGTGILGLHALSLGASRIIFIDINPFAVEATNCTLKINHKENYADIINCDLLTCVRSRKIDFVIFNPPYLPFEEYESWIGYSWSGGKSGVDVILRFLDQVNAKRVYLVYSSLSDEEKIERKLREKQYMVTTEKDIVIGYEDIIAIEAVKK
ncbi:MAG: methyltransferase [Sulfolobus sp.]|nr:methyltransferase [Sulfolobus sp.]